MEITSIITLLGLGSIPEETKNNILDIIFGEALEKEVSHNNNNPKPGPDKKN